MSKAFHFNTKKTKKNSCGSVNTLDFADLRLMVRWKQSPTSNPSKLVATSLPTLKELTLTVVDGDFPRQVIANQNLKFSDFSMAASRNNRDLYDSKLHAPAPKLGGIRVSSLDEIPRESFDGRSSQVGDRWTSRMAVAALGFSSLFILLIRFSPLRRR